MKKKKAKTVFFSKGFTAVEILIVIAIMIAMISLSTPLFRSFQKESDLVQSSEKIINILRLAQNKTLASERDSQWGVLFATSTDSYELILFKGASFDSREAGFDEAYGLPKSVEIFEVSLEEGKSEIVFNRLTGTTYQFGNISLRLKEGSFEEKTIFIEKYGQFSFGQALVPSDEERIKDSRRLHFNYSRHIDVSLEKIILTFTYNNSAVTQEIIIAENIRDNQIYWQGEIDVDGSSQSLRIHTYRLNDADTRFCIHRDRRYNDKALKIELSEDSTGALVEYSADGLITTNSSIYTSNAQWQ